MAITPRHYLDFINQYANLFNEKRSELEEQQMHLNVGLRKIKETVDQVGQSFLTSDFSTPVIVSFFLESFVVLPLYQGGGASPRSPD